MQKDSHFFDDLAKMADGAMGTLAQMKREMEAMAAAQVEKMLSGMNLVRREEFEAVREMAAKARLEQEKLEARLTALEKKSEGTPS